LSPQHTSRQPIRVAHLIQYFAVGGLERMVERLAAASKRRGVDSVVIAYLGDGPVRAALEAAGVQTVLMSQGEGLHPALTWQLTSFLRRERIDILHTHHLGPFLYGAPAAVLARCRRVHTEHSHELYDRPRRRLVGAMMSPLADVVAVTPEISEFRRRFPGECRVIRNGVPLPDPDPQLRERGRALLGATDESFVVGCAARLSEEKDHAGLLDAFAELAVREPRAILACAGDGPLAEPLRARSAAAGLEDRVRWLGTLDDMPTFYAALDVCVLNSTREGLPLSLLEAMAFGVPIVATDVGGVGELLEGDAGVLVPPSQPSVLATELASLANDPTRAQTVGRRGETKVRAEYSVDRMADDYVALYRSLVRRRLPRVGMESAQCV
jgi:glycosyltransferase involved in cell wall biosynthesis